MEEISSCELPKALSKQQITELFIKYKNGDQNARELILSHNLRLVFHIAQKYVTCENKVDDLFSIGVLGLVKAVDTFDLEKNILFSSYAGECIKNELFMFFRRKQKQIKWEIMEVSINTPIDNKNDDLFLSDIIVDPKVNIIEDYEQKETIKELLTIVDNLPRREKEIIYFYFGLRGTKQYNQAEISKIYNISRTYVGKIINRALKKIKKQLEIHYKNYNVTESIVNNKKKQLSILPKSLENEEKVISVYDEEYIKELELLKIPTYTEMLSSFTPKEAIIISLKLGFINGKIYETEKISNFLKIDKEEIEQTVLKFLNFYKDNIQYFIDKLQNRRGML